MSSKLGCRVRSRSTPWMWAVPDWFACRATSTSASLWLGMPNRPSMEAVFVRLRLRSLPAFFSPRLWLHSDSFISKWTMATAKTCKDDFTSQAGGFPLLLVSQVVDKRHSWHQERTNSFSPGIGCVFLLKGQHIQESTIRLAGPTSN